MNKKKPLMLVSALLVLIVFSGCIKQQNLASESNQQTSQEKQTQLNSLTNVVTGDQMGCIPARYTKVKVVFG